MELLSELLPIIIYVLLIVLLIFLIIIAYKLVVSLNKVEEIIDDVEKKVHSFDRAFELLNFTTDKITNITDSLITKVTNFISGFGRKKKNKRYVEEEYDDEL